MTTLYKPVLIESAEQAEALPKGSVVFDGDPEDGDTYVHVGGEWHTDGYPGLLSEALDLGFTATALVPVEAVEETREHPYRVEERPESAYQQPVPQVRYKTPWEDA